MCLMAKLSPMRWQATGFFGYLGAVNSRDTRSLTQCARNIFHAVLAQGVERAVVTSVAGVADRGCLLPRYSKQLFPTLLKPVLQHHTEEEAIFAKSELNWTALHAAVLTNRQA